MKLPEYPIVKYLEELNTLEAIGPAKGLEVKKKLFSKGSLRVYRADGVTRFSNLTVKGLNFYHYDFGIAYPQEGLLYPLFMYQVILTPDRALALVHFPFYSQEKAKSLAGIEELLEMDQDYSFERDLLLKNYKPQDFLAAEIIPNSFNGLIRTTDVEAAYRAIAQLFKGWHGGLMKNIDAEFSRQEHEEFAAWKNSFEERFYREDFGYKATRRYLGGEWATEVFEQYIFDIK